MNLERLFGMQKGLDEHIIREHPIKAGENRVEKKVLAFQVELGELVNELPEVFKFWSTKKNNYDLALEEFVDGVHFLLSIGLDLELTDVIVVEVDSSSILNSISQCYKNSVKLEVLLLEELGTLKRRIKNAYSDLFSSYMTLGVMLGFTWDQVEKAYIAKNSINHQRQVQGY